VGGVSKRSWGQAGGRVGWVACWGNEPFLRQGVRQSGEMDLWVRCTREGTKGGKMWDCRGDFQSTVSLGRTELGLGQEKFVFKRRENSHVFKGLEKGGAGQERKVVQLSEMIRAVNLGVGT